MIVFYSFFILLVSIHICFKKKLKYSFLNSFAIIWFCSFLNIFIWSELLTVCLTSILIILFFSVDIAKYKIVRERLNYEDIFLYSQVFKFPKFYIPFVGYRKFWLLSILIILAFFLIMSLNILSLIHYFNLQNWLLRIALFIFLNSLILIITNFIIIESLHKSVSKYGLFMSILLYFYSKSSKKIECKALEIYKQMPKNIIVVQSESFIIVDDCDIDYPKNIINGPLSVPCFGAYTMRTEFSFLTGLAADNLGKNNFNPYRTMYKSVSKSYVQQLKELGYYCVAIHPFEKKFFNREKVFKHFGFDDFIDDTSFSKNDIFTSDKELGEFVKKYIETNKNEKIFIFIITVAAHGPYSLPRKDPQKHYSKVKNDDANVYIDLNYKANEMLKSLLEVIESNDDGLLIWYGDHRPSIGNWNFSNQNIYQTNFFLSTKKKSIIYTSRSKG